MGAVLMAYGVLAALMARERFGIGQEVDASHLGSMSFLQGLSLSCKLMMGFAFPRTFRAKAPNPLWSHYRCADDKWLALGMLQPDRYWADLCRTLERPELIDDPRFAEMRKRTENAEACVTILDAVFATRPRAEWMERLKQGGDFIFTVVNSVDDLPEDPQMRINGYIVDLDHPSFGKTPMVGVPVRLSETPGSVREPAPELGQHTELLLTELLGYDWDKVADLRARKVI
jgi:crotonobetainyl-CoA:carnitine CoA-transferase CaiB-like acyl-CoA transferase